MSEDRNIRNLLDHDVEIDMALVNDCLDHVVDQERFEDEAHGELSGLVLTIMHAAARLGLDPGEVLGAATRQYDMQRGHVPG